MLRSHEVVVAYHLVIVGGWLAKVMGYPVFFMSCLLDINTVNHHTALVYFHLALMSCLLVITTLGHEVSTLQLLDLGT